MRRQVVLLLAVMGAVVLLAAGVALADNITCPSSGGTCNGTESPDNITGSSKDDTIDARAGNDTVNARGGADTIDGGSGADTIDGGSGADTIDGGSGADMVSGGSGADDIDTSGDGTKDSVTCGFGDDEVMADQNDVVSGNCEKVTRVSS